MNKSFDMFSRGYCWRVQCEHAYAVADVATVCSMSRMPGHKMRLCGWEILLFPSFFLEDTDGRETVAKFCNITGQELYSRMIFILDTAQGNMNIC